MNKTEEIQANFQRITEIKILGIVIVAVQPTQEYFKSHSYMIDEHSKIALDELAIYYNHVKVIHPDHDFDNYINASINDVI